MVWKPSAGAFLRKRTVSFITPEIRTKNRPADKFIAQFYAVGMTFLVFLLYLLPFFKKILIQYYYEKHFYHRNSADVCCFRHTGARH